MENDFNSLNENHRSTDSSTENGGNGIFPTSGTDPFSQSTGPVWNIPQSTATPSEEPHTAHYTYSPGAESSVYSQPAAEQTPSAHDYSTDHVIGTGDISYIATPAPKKKKSSGKMSKGLVAMFVALGLVASVGCGMIGGYFTSVVKVVESGNSPHGNLNSTVVYRNVESVTTSSDGSDLTYADIEKLTGDSVVAITTEYKNVGLWQYVTSGAGSGVVISEDGYIITNNHVICRSDNSSKFADRIIVVLKNGEEYEASVVGGDANSDIAVIKIAPESELTCAVFADSDKLAVGEEVIAIGNPLGELSGTMTNGIISALARKINVDGVEMNLLQTNAAINPGNSGGGLFNMRGELIGIVNAKSSGTGIEGLGFAIPSNDALEKSTEIIENGNVSSIANVKIGIMTLDIFNESDARKYGVNSFGVYIAEVEEGYNDNVLKAGDRIVAIDEQEITSGQDVVDIVRASKAGDTLKFIMYRDGRLVYVDVTCYEGAPAERDNIEF